MRERTHGHIGIDLPVSGEQEPGRGVRLSRRRAPGPRPVRPQVRTRAASGERRGSPPSGRSRRRRPSGRSPERRRSVGRSRACARGRRRSCRRRSCGRCVVRDGRLVVRWALAVRWGAGGPPVADVRWRCGRPPGVRGGGGAAGAGRPWRPGRGSWSRARARPSRAAATGSAVSLAGLALVLAAAAVVVGLGRVADLARRAGRPRRPRWPMSPRSPSRWPLPARCGTSPTVLRPGRPVRSGRRWSTGSSRPTRSPRCGCGRARCCGCLSEATARAWMMTLRAGSTASRQWCGGDAPVRATRHNDGAHRLPPTPHLVVTLVLFDYRWGSPPLGPGRGCAAVRCPFCRHPDSRVIDSREVEDGQAIRRRRSCPECARRFTTVEEAVLAVVKRSGVTEPFSRAKVVAGVTPGLPGPAGRRGRAGPARPAGRGDGPGRRARRGAQPGGRAGHPRAAARPRRGGLPPVRVGLPLVHLGRRLRRRDRTIGATSAAHGGDPDRRPRATPGAPARRTSAAADPARRRRRAARRTTSTPSPTTARPNPRLPRRRKRNSMTEIVGTATGSGAQRSGAPGSGGRGRRARRPKRSTGLTLERLYTTAGVHPYDEVTWERRDVVMTNWRDGSVNFEQRGVEFPDFWSVNATNIVTSKYFRGRRRHRARASRACGRSSTGWSPPTPAPGASNGYFATDADDEIFAHELTWMLLHQVFASTRRSGSTSEPRPRSRSRPASSCPSTTRWTRS